MPRTPVACGALGAYDRERVLRSAAALTPDLRVVHEDEGAILLLDREPRRWGGDREGSPSGWAWPSVLAPAGEPSDWRGVAREWNSCGLELGPEGPRLHTSSAGISPLYLKREREATYFATSIDPLVRGSSGQLSTDWQAWASIITLGMPVGGRTPFEEIEHLGPFRTAKHPTGGEASVEAHSWPWKEIEPRLGAAEGAEAIAAALVDVFSRLEGQRLLVPMSAGRDSRLLCWLALRCGAESVRAYTTYEDTGTHAALDLAVDAARSLGVDHTQIHPAVADYWDDARIYQSASDYQFPNTPWLTGPLRRALGGQEGMVVDGIAGNALFQPSARDVIPQVVTRPGPEWRALLWQKTRSRALRAGFRQEEAAAIGALAREQFLASCDPYTDHPARAALAFYETRTVRGIAHRPAGALGQVCEVVGPLAETPVAEALLSVRADEKFDRRLYSEVFRALGAAVEDVPFSSEGAGATHDEVPRRRVSPEALAGYREIVGSGPLRPYLSGKIRGWLANPEQLLPNGGRQAINGMERTVTFHLWYERYADRLRPFSLPEVLGTPLRPRGGGSRTETVRSG